ncbi:MAG: ParB/RepB/Spo0J family partition protein [Pirellulaceae bacterium]
MPKDQIQQVPIDKVKANPQVRKEFSAESLDALAQSIRQVGLLFPIIVRAVDGVFVILDGERRYRAAIALGWKAVPAIVTTDSLTEGEVIQRQLIANCQREGLSACEQSDAIASLMERTGWTQTEVAEHLGMSGATVTRLLALQVLPEPIREQVRAGKIAASAAYELARVGDAAKQQELAGQLASGKLTRDGLAGALKAGRKKETPAKTSSRVTAKLGLNRAVTVVSESLTLESFIEILEELLGRARKVRSQGVELATFCRMTADQAKG